MHKIVHFDFKGAPLMVPYMEKIILLAKSWGATGILFEWEDTFPYTIDLVDVGSLGTGNREGMYSLPEIRHILEFTKENGLVAIQLVQTFGHLEFVLKHKQFKELREEATSAASLCPLKNGSQKIVKTMLDQILEVQPDAEYLHIGADEVWHIKVCDDCRNSVDGKNALYLKHIQQMAKFVKQRRPDVTVLMWDDMLRNIDANVLKVYQLGELVQPVVWDYNVPEHFNIQPAMWRRYVEVFPKMWAASAFKGANGSCKMVPDVARYVSNQTAWIKEFEKLGAAATFTGIILTGWSRYDHYATLCEMMPVSLQSLKSCLAALTVDPANTDDHAEASILEEMWSFSEEFQQLLSEFDIIKQQCFNFIYSDAVTTHFNPWQRQHRFVHPLQIRQIEETARTLEHHLASLKIKLQLHLRAFTGPRTESEWLETHVTPLWTQISKMKDDARCALGEGPSVLPT